MTFALCLTIQSNSKQLKTQFRNNSSRLRDNESKMSYMNIYAIIFDTSESDEPAQNESNFFPIIFDYQFFRHVIIKVEYIREILESLIRYTCLQRSGERKTFHHFF